MNEDMEKTYRPRRFTFHLTERCQYTCLHCWMSHGRVRLEHLPAETWLDAAAAICDTQEEIENIVLCGGEPLLRPETFKLIEYLARRGVTHSLNTNAYAVNREKAERLADLGLARINISIDGPAPVHNAIRKHPRAYDRAMEAAHLMAEISPNTEVAVNCTLMGANIGSIKELVELIESDPAFQTLSFQAITNPFDSFVDQRLTGNPELWPQDTEEAAGAVEWLIEKRRAGYKIVNPESQLKLFAKYFQDPHAAHSQSCTVSEFGMSLLNTGDVLLCHYMKPIGNMKQKRFADILASDTLAPLIREMEACTRTNCHQVMNCYYLIKEDGNRA